MEAETGSSHNYIIILKKLNCFLIYKMRGRKGISQAPTFLRNYSSEIIKWNVFLIYINFTLKPCTSNFSLVHIFTAERTAGTSGNKSFYYGNAGIVLARVGTRNIP